MNRREGAFWGRPGGVANGNGVSLPATQSQRLRLRSALPLKRALLSGVKTNAVTALAPPTHNLVLLADQLKRAWSDDERRQLDDLTQYAVRARYDDPSWAQREATEENSCRWIPVAENLLSLLLP